MNLPLAPEDVEPTFRNEIDKSWPPHLSPWNRAGVTDGARFPTMSESPIAMMEYTPFAQTLRLVRGELTDRDIEAITTLHYVDVYAVNKIQESLRTLLNGQKVVLAGGCIRDFYLFEGPQNIKDLDVWILNCDKARADKILDTVSDLAFKFGGDYWPSADYFMSRLRNQPKNQTLEIGNINGLNIPHPIQVIATEAVTVEELIGNFDWGICRFAYDGTTLWFPGWNDVIAKHLTLGENVRDPYWTMRRGVLFSEKFKKLPRGRSVRLRKQDVMLLLHMWMMEFDGKDEATAKG